MRVSWYSFLKLERRVEHVDRGVTVLYFFCTRRSLDLGSSSGNWHPCSRQPRTTHPSACYHNAIHASPSRAAVSPGSGARTPVQSLAQSTLPRRSKATWSLHCICRPPTSNSPWRSLSWLEIRWLRDDWTASIFDWRNKAPGAVSPDHVNQIWKALSAW